MSGADPYAELAELAEAAALLAERQGIGELGPLFERGAALRASLPARPPRSAAPQLRRAAAAQQRLRASLGATLEQTRGELELVGRGRRASRSYAGPAPSAVDLQA